jgi:hypothetical protein
MGHAIFNDTYVSAFKFSHHLLFYYYVCGSTALALTDVLGSLARLGNEAFVWLG